MSAVALSVLEDDDIRKSIYIREFLNNGKRNFAFSRDAQNSYTKDFNAVKHDIRLMNFARDIVGAISDCYILYAVSMMGVCDIESIMIFLRVLSKKNKDLAIYDTGDYDAYKKRVDSLFRNGFLFKHTYEYQREKKDGRKVTVRVNMYTIEKSAMHMVAQKLGAHIVVNEWIDAKPLSELMGWAACGYVRARIADGGEFLEYKQGRINTKAIGTAMYPGEVKMRGASGEKMLVGFVQGFMRYNKTLQTEEQHMDSCLRTVNTIKQFFYLRDTQNKNPYVVVVVEDNPDLMKVGEIIQRSGILKGDYERIYFTGEGAVRDTPNNRIGECFLQLRDLGGSEFDFIPAVPVFLP